MVDRKFCSHRAIDTCVLFISWCERCAGWRFVRASSSAGLRSVPDSVELYESHFLPVEETSPDELLILVQRAFRSAQEWQQDQLDHMQLDFDA